MAQPLHTLQPNGLDFRVSPGYGLSFGLGNYVLVFLLAAVIVFLILWWLKPALVQKVNSAGQPTGELDMGKVLVGVLLAGVIAILVFWLFRAGCPGSAAVMY